jgi:hypothetical protein
VVLENVKMIIQEDIGGKADRKGLSKAFYLNKLSSLMQIVGKLNHRSEVLKKLIIEGYKIIGEDF